MGNCIKVIVSGIVNLSYTFLHLSLEPNRNGFIRGACVVLFGGACVVLFGGTCVVFSVFSDTMRYGQ